VGAPIVPRLSAVEEVAYARCVGKSTPQQPVDTASRELAESLLAQAGLGAVVDIRPATGYCFERPLRRRNQ